MFELNNFQHFKDLLFLLDLWCI